jgi:hypothetical protein
MCCTTHVRMPCWQPSMLVVLAAIPIAHSKQLLAGPAELIFSPLPAWEDSLARFVKSDLSPGIR